MSIRFDSRMMKYQVNKDLYTVSVNIGSFEFKSSAEQALNNLMQELEDNGCRTVMRDIDGYFDINMLSVWCNIIQKHRLQNIKRAPKQINLLYFYRKGLIRESDYERVVNNG